MRIVVPKTQQIKFSDSSEIRNLEPPKSRNLLLSFPDQSVIPISINLLHAGGQVVRNSVSQIGERRVRSGRKSTDGPTIFD